MQLLVLFTLIPKFYDECSSVLTAPILDAILFAVVAVHDDNMTYFNVLYPQAPCDNDNSEFLIFCVLILVLFFVCAASCILLVFDVCVAFLAIDEDNGENHMGKVPWQQHCI